MHIAEAITAATAVPANNAMVKGIGLFKVDNIGGSKRAVK